MSHNQETDLLAPHAADGLIHTNGATVKIGGSGVSGEKSKTKKKKKGAGGEHMKYHKPTSKRRALQVRCGSLLKQIMFCGKTAGCITRSMLMAPITLNTG